jgi:hypothetical protein
MALFSGDIGDMGNRSWRKMFLANSILLIAISIPLTIWTKDFRYLYWLTGTGFIFMFMSSSVTNEIRKFLYYWGTKRSSVNKFLKMEDVRIVTYFGLNLGQPRHFSTIDDAQLADFTNRLESIYGYSKFVWVLYKGDDFIAMNQDFKSVKYIKKLTKVQVIECKEDVLKKAHNQRIKTAKKLCVLMI